VATKTSDKLINTNKHFLASLPGKVASTGSIDKLILFDVIEMNIDAQTGLPLFCLLVYLMQGNV
jgi:hypothetical protein